MKIDPIDPVVTDELYRSIQALEKFQQEVKGELGLRHGPVKDYRSSSIIAAAIKSASLTPHEMGQILGAITDRICSISDLEPEFEAIANDLSETCEDYTEAENKRDERLCEENIGDRETWLEQR